MNEFIEKLIQRLEELKTDAIDKWDGGASHKAYSKAIEIVNQLAEEYKPKTNADRIRSMTDEELAELFTKLAWNSEVQTTPLKYLEWLQSEVEGK